MGNLTVRKVYGKDQIRFLRCRACSKEFSERRNTALFGTKGEWAYASVPRNRGPNTTLGKALRFRA